MAQVSDSQPFEDCKTCPLESPATNTRLATRQFIGQDLR